ncbi:hypothetical protein [uncultured Shewanella sp.]|uniref:hypothetical protein n=1 Tax=uncultured Shewanella sp. TaxID=173975 RepID=UPI00262F2199|nr:hypothetical protein [uncultured Shewanella sp.]
MKFVISSPDFWYQIDASFDKSGGMYILSCLGDESIPRPISRLLGLDSEGILYLGMASSFLDRVIELKKSLSPSHCSRSHDCGVRYKNHQEISTMFPYDRLQIELIRSDDPKVTEQEALRKYLEEFGELPPLNRVS